jgi:hypothetical protein
MAHRVEYRPDLDDSKPPQPPQPAAEPATATPRNPRPAAAATAVARAAATRSTMPETEAAAVARAKRDLAPLVQKAHAAVADVAAIAREHAATLRAYQEIDFSTLRAYGYRSEHLIIHFTRMLEDAQRLVANAGPTLYQITDAGERTRSGRELPSIKNLVYDDVRTGPALGRLQRDLRTVAAYPAALRGNLRSLAVYAEGFNAFVARQRERGVQPARTTPVTLDDDGGRGMIQIRAATEDNPHGVWEPGR